MSNNSSPGTVTSTEVREMLRTAAQRLSAREEKALRMRQGARLDPNAPLPRRGQQHVEARAELLALEIELSRKLEQRAQASATPVRTKEKDKIIRALRRLK
jgi:Tfp pilus assembly protein PilF